MSVTLISNTGNENQCLFTLAASRRTRDAQISVLSNTEYILKEVYNHMAWEN